MLLQGSPPRRPKGGWGASLKGSVPIFLGSLCLPSNFKSPSIQKRSDTVRLETFVKVKFNVHKSSCSGS